MGRQSRRRASPKPKRRLSFAGGPRLVAGWQRALLWAAWLATALVLWSHSAYGSWGWTEGGVFLASVCLSIWCWRQPRGMAKIVIRDPAGLTGEFRSRTNWPWLFFSGFVLFGGIATCVKVAYDLKHHFTTPGGVLADIVEFFTQWMWERLTLGRSGDVTKTRLYILMVLAPIGAVMVWYNLRPLLNRGRPFRIAADGAVQTLEAGDWTLLQPASTAAIAANGVSIRFDDARGRPQFRLPQWRVFSVELQTEAPRHVIASRFRLWAENHGFRVTTHDRRGRLETQWSARRAP